MTLTDPDSVTVIFVDKAFETATATSSCSFHSGSMPRAIEKLMLHPAQYTEKAECDITRFIMVSPTLGGPRGDADGEKAKR